MRYVLGMLACILALCICANCRAAELLEQVAAAAPAYQQLRLLESRGMLPTSGGNALAATPPQGSRLLTRYDVALLLIEPLERFCALVEYQDNPGAAPELRRRQELAYQAVSSLSADDFHKLTLEANKLLLSFTDAIEELSPGLTPRAATALRKLGLPRYCPWVSQATPAAGSTRSVRISVDPEAAPNAFANPLPLLPTRSGRPGALPMRPDAGGSIGTAIVGSRPMNSLEAAMDLAVGRFRLYGTLSALPGEDPAVFLKPDGSKRGMLGFQFDIGHLSDFGVSGIFQYHFQRFVDPGSTTANTNVGMVGGIGLSW